MIVIKNLTKGKDIVFDSHPFLLNRIEFNASDATHFTSKGVNQHGTILTNSTLESRDIPITGYIMNSESIEIDKRKLNNILSPLDEIEIVKDNIYKISGKLTSTVKFGVGKDGSSQACKFMFTLFCPKPFFMSTNEDKQSISAWNPNFTFPFSMYNENQIIFGSRTPKTVIEVINEGDIECGLVCEFIAKGNVVNPKIYDMNTNKEMELRYTMQEGERIVMNTNAGEKSIISILNGVEKDLIGAFNFFTSWDFIQLEVGLNTIKFEASQNSDLLEVYISHSPLYLGVE